MVTSATLLSDSLDSLFFMHVGERKTANKMQGFFNCFTRVAQVDIALQLEPIADVQATIDSRSFA